MVRAWLVVVVAAVCVVKAPPSPTPSPLIASPLLLATQDQLWDWRQALARHSKSLALLDEAVRDNAVDEEEKDEKKKTPKLNVSDKDSPYALIDKYFPERESYYYQNKNKFINEYSKHGGNRTDIGTLKPEEVWLSEGKLLVLKGGSTPDRDGFDNPWKPIDSYEAPYREPVLPPPDFDPDSIEVRVALPDDAAVPPTSPRPTFGRAAALAAERELDDGYNVTPRLEGRRPFVDPEVALRQFKDEVHSSDFGDDDPHGDFLLGDVRQFINDMENFHSARQAPPVAVGPPEVATVRPTTPSSSFTFTPKPVFTAATAPPPPPSFSTTTAPPPPFRPPETSARPNFFQTQRLPKSFAPATTALPRSTFAPPPQRRSTLAPSPRPPSPRIRFFTTTLRPPPPRRGTYTPPPRTRPTPPPLSLTPPPPYRATTPSPYSPYSYRPLGVTFHSPSTTTTTTTTPRPPLYNRQLGVTFRPPAPTTATTPRPILSYRPVGVTFHPPAPTPTTTARPLLSYQTALVNRRPSTTPVPPGRVFSPLWEPVGPAGTTTAATTAVGRGSPTPYNVFQSLPENIGETDVFHLSQHFDFGKKLEGPPSNEVDTGPGRSPVSPHKQQPVQQQLVQQRRVAKPRRRIQRVRNRGHQAQVQRKRQAAVRRKVPLSGTRKERQRTTVRRRRPKSYGAQPVIDRRQGPGDVRYVSFYSGSTGGQSWGYSYRLGR